MTFNSESQSTASNNTESAVVCSLSDAVPRKPPVIPFIWQFCSICNPAHSNCAPCYLNSSLNWNDSFRECK